MVDRMSRPAKFRVAGRFDLPCLQEATVTIDRDAKLFHVRILRRRRVYTMPLSNLAEMVVFKTIVAEHNERAKARKMKRRKSAKL